jgi:hypothetical protein
MGGGLLSSTEAIGRAIGEIQPEYGKVPGFAGFEYVEVW